MAGDRSIVLFMYIRFHYVDRVKRQFGSEQPIPLDPVNLDGFLRTSARGENKWWPAELDYWYGFWNNRRAREHQIQIVPTQYPGWPTKDYIDWWVARDPIVLPRDAPASGRRTHAQPGREDFDEEGGADSTPQEENIDFFSGADLELARFILQGEGSGSRFAPHISAGGPSGHQV
ncbi:hypothetical protein PIB30_049505 [Stylosanthes scabra]|uniref:Aminotransferase-like plant mobile domain-containing protein n=1 Tax=Stylosanthes scabra TaxID=79078 RepID=A0ABU6TH26_9FABA|nr:hypothetical protein [Stylosanthes scabra]